MRNPINTQRGVTLVELIVSMVIISIALTGVLVVMNFTVSHSADPVIQHQAIAIAEAYMEEITLQAYRDPGGGTESGRADFDDVDDYNGLHDVGARNQISPDDPISGLENYTVDVEVEDVTLNGVDAKKITVRVQRGQLVNLTLVGYRTEY